jgi:hypothetical protein
MNPYLGVGSPPDPQMTDIIADSPSPRRYFAVLGNRNATISIT